MKCPVCDVELQMADRQGVEIDYCPQCRGIWLDRGELDKLIERSADYETQKPQPAPFKRKHGEQFYPDAGHDDDERYRNDDSRHPYGKRRRSFLGDLFDDIFD